MKCPFPEDTGNEWRDPVVSHCREERATLICLSCRPPPMTCLFWWLLANISNKVAHCGQELFNFSELLQSLHCGCNASLCGIPLPTGAARTDRDCLAVSAERPRFVPGYVPC